VQFLQLLTAALIRKSSQNLGVVPMNKLQERFFLTWRTEQTGSQASRTIGGGRER